MRQHGIPYYSSIRHRNNQPNDPFLVKYFLLKKKKIFLAVFVSTFNNKAPGGSTNVQMRLPHNLIETKQ